MLTRLDIKNFKCFSHLNITPLAKVNLFVGGGNSGKTSVLEAISWLPNNSESLSFGPAVSFRDASMGTMCTPTFQRWIFRNLDEQLEVVIEASGVKEAEPVEIYTKVSLQERRSLERANFARLQPVISLNSGHGIFWSKSTDRQNHSRPVIRVVNTDRRHGDQMAIDFDRWTKRPENDDRFVNILQAVDPRLKSLRAMDPEATGQRMVYADVRLPERIPLPMLGDGFNRLVQIVGAIIGEDADIVLVDEIENGLHWKALPQVWQGLKAAVSSSDVQIFATTHSYECIRAAIEVFRGDPRGELAVHRLERRDDGQIHCVTIEEDMLEQAVDAEWEIR